MKPASRALLLSLLLLVACSEGPPDRPGDGGTAITAGGGRQSDQDPFAGGPDGSGPTRPDFEPPEPGLSPLFYADQDCQENPSRRVISTPGEWQAWWSAATACVRPDGNLPPPPPPGGEPADSGVVYPDTLFDPYPTEAPPVDFDRAAVLAIALEPDSAIGRSVWIQEAAPAGAGSVVRYRVSRLGEGCLGEILPPFLVGATSPTIAVAVPLPLPEPIEWAREEKVYDCSWEPDPNLPVALYYTDAPCDLGPAESLISDPAALEDWLARALECDQARWQDPAGPGTPGGAPTDSVPGSPTLPPPSSIGLDVDFSQYAVIVLRSDPQDHWGGGIWLSDIQRADGGTTIEYTVKVPGDDCPVVEGGTLVQPTVLIRVPLPVDPPVTWVKNTESIACAWGDGGPAPPPR